MVKVLFISASSRKGGNTDYMMDQAALGAEEASVDGVEIEKYYLRGKKISGCLNCAKCGDLGGECVIQDDFQALRDKWVEADVVIYSVPVYHMSYPGQLSCFFDRLGNTQFVFHNMSSPKTMKVFGGIAQGLHIFSGQEHALTDLMNHAYLSGGIYVTGDLWENYIGAAGWTNNEIDKDAIKKNYEAGEIGAVTAVKAARTLGRRCVETAAVIVIGAQERIDIFESQPIYGPFAERLKSKSKN